MKRIFLVLALLASFTSFLYFKYNQVKPISLPSPTPIQSLDSDKLFQLVNEWRTQNGYQAYLKDQRLCDIASDRADDFDYSHAGLYEKYSGYRYVIQENLVYNYLNEQASLNGWLGSPGHLSTLKKPYLYSCIACDGRYCSQIFSSFSVDKTNPF